MHKTAICRNRLAKSYGYHRACTEPPCPNNGPSLLLALVPRLALVLRVFPPLVPPHRSRKKAQAQRCVDKLGSLCCLLPLRPFLCPMFSPDNRIRCAVLSFFFLQMKISHAKLTFRILQPLKIKCLLNIVLTGSVHKAYVFDRKNNLFFPIRDNLHILCYMTSQRNAFCSFTTFTPARWKACIAYDISNSRQAHAEVYTYAKI